MEGAGDENEPPKGQRKSVPGQYSRASQAARKEEAAWHLLTLSLARDYSFGHGIGEKATLNTRLFPGVSVEQLRYARRGGNKRLNGDRKPSDVLTDAEQQSLADWIMSSARLLLTTTSRTDCGSVVT